MPGKHVDRLYLFLPRRSDLEVKFIILLSTNRKAERFSVAISITAVLRSVIIFLNISVPSRPVSVPNTTAGTKNTCRSEEKYV